MSENKLVSVIIPTYKRAVALSRAIDSVLNQTYRNIQIIVVDDNDPDTQYRKDTEHMMEKYNECDNVMYIKHEKNKNGSAARNTGIKHTNGEYIMFLDDDDEFLPVKVSAQVECLSMLDESWGACYTNYIRKKNDVIVAYGSEKREGSLLSDELMRNLFVHAGSNLMIRKTVVDETNGFDESFERNQDIEFLSRILVKYKLAYVDKVGLIVHVHEKTNNREIFEDITKNYMEKFSTVIDKLSEEDRTKITNMINLQLFRNFITTSGKRKKAMRMILSGELSLILAGRYMLHLLNRKLSKKVYGFRV